MLHGLPKDYAFVGKAHTLHDWTDGCIAVSNEEMDEIWKLSAPALRLKSSLELLWVPGDNVPTLRPHVVMSSVTSSFNSPSEEPNKIPGQAEFEWGAPAPVGHPSG